MTVIKDFTKEFKDTGFFVLYLVLFFSVSLLTISFIAFFHFMLDHSFQTIELWITESLWEIASASTFFGTILYYRLVLVDRRFRSVYFDIKNELFSGKSDNIFQLTIFWYLFIFFFYFLLQPLTKINHDFSLYNWLRYSFFSISLYLFPLFVIYKIRKKENYDRDFFRKKEGVTYVFNFLVSVLLFLVLSLISTSQGGANSGIFFEILTAVFLIEITKSFKSVIYFYCLCIIPLNSLVNVHPFNVSDLSYLLIIDEGFKWKLIFSLSCVTCLYMLFKSKVRNSDSQVFQSGI